MTEAPLHLRFAAVSDVGRYRKDNQDSGYVGPRLLAVCDGVGGAVRGDIASSTVLGQLLSLAEPLTGDPRGAIENAVEKASHALVDVIEAIPELSGTSTTATFGVFDGEQLTLGHIGDSRAYLLREGELSQLTTDHTFVQTLIDEGRISEDEARTHPHRNLILRALDGIHEATPDILSITLQVGDRLLFCSDGAMSLRNEQLAEYLAEGDVTLAPGRLVWESLEAGSTDNVTVVAAEVIDEESFQEPATVGAAASKRRPFERQPSTRSTLNPLRRGRENESASRAELPDELDFAISADPLDEEAQRYAPLAPQQFGWLRTLSLWLILVGLGAGALAVGWRWAQSQYFVSDRDGKVAIYRGIDANLLGFNMATAVETSDVELDRLPVTDADNIRNGLPADSKKDAQDIVDRFGEQQLDPPAEQSDA